MIQVDVYFFAYAFHTEFLGTTAMFQTAIHPYYK